MSHYIYITLVRTNTVLSKTISAFTKGQYTHSNISLTGNLDEMYSFGRKFAFFPFWGVFLKEDINKGLYRFCDKLPAVVIRVSVTKEQYACAKEIIDGFCSNHYCYSYNYAGLLASVFNTRTFNKNEFLCSEFVYHVLYESGIADFNKPRNLVKPMDFLNIKGKIIFEGDLKTKTTAYSEPPQRPRKAILRLLSSLRMV